jgi:hypothetical protein
MATYLAGLDERKCPLCERILTSNRYEEHIKEELQKTQNLLADYEVELYEKDRQIQWLEDIIHRRVGIHPQIAVEQNCSPQSEAEL